MKKLLVISILILIVSNSTFAGGILTNTNQHISFLRMIARGASIDIDGVYSNPAGLAFLDNGFYISVNGQSAYQTRIINADFGIYPTGTFKKEYKGTASAPFIPSVQAAYRMGDWTISGSFAVTGGGGKASFDEGLPMFDSKVMALIFQSSQGTVTPEMYTINSAMDGRQIIYGAQLGLTYKITDYLAVFAGGRMNYVSSGYEGFLNAALKNGTGIAVIGLDCDQTGWGLTPIIGADVKLGKWNLGLKYEFITNINIENKSKITMDPQTPALEAALEPYKNGVNTPNDIPALLTAALGYEILPSLRATIEYHHFFDKQATMAKVSGTDIHKNKTLTGGTHEYLLGAEYDINKLITVSAGYQRTDYGLSDDFQSDTSFSLDSYSIGLGAAVNLSSRLKLNVGYFWTSYDDYTKESKAGDSGSGYNGTGLSGTDVYSRTNKVFGIGLDYTF